MIVQSAKFRANGGPYPAQHMECMLMIDIFGLDFGDALHIFTFGIRTESKEHRVDIESEDPKRGAAVVGIPGREG